MLSIIAKIYNSIPVWLWITICTSLVTVFTFLIQKRWRIALRYGFYVLASLSLVSLLFCWLAYLDNHFIGSYSESGLPTNFSASGWRLIFHAWPLWLGPVVIFTGLLFFVCWAIAEMQISCLPDSDNVMNDQTGAHQAGLASKNVIMHGLESAKLKRKLAIAEEKYKMALEKNTKPSAKDTRTTMNIKQLREHLVEAKRINTTLKNEIESLNNDLKRTNNLVDQLLEEKYGKQ